MARARVEVTLGVGTAWLAVLAAAAPPVPVREQALRTVDGKKIVATIEGQTVRARPEVGGALADGTYKLDNGGEIRVRRGEVVWHAFGTVERLKKPRSSHGPIRIG